ncbi:MAG: hypothetical protein Q9227_004503 [Pyrenula ochraceoflavens]
MEESPCLQPEESETEIQERHNGLELIHAIMIPAYREDIELLKETLKVLASHTLATRSYDVFLAMEERDPNAVVVATKLESSFKHKFRDVQHTIHPAAIPGEEPGKSSNISWAAQKVQEKYRDTKTWSDVLLTVMDSDTHLLSDYFRIIHRRHIRHRQQSSSVNMTLYMPPIVFDRNAHRIPLLVRVADLSQKRGVAIPTSVYTVTLPLVNLVHGWDADAGAIGEDMHMMLKCYYGANGQLAIESVPSPASQCNISTNLLGIRGWLANHRARYSQALRHMWGCLDSGYAVHKWLTIGNKNASSANSVHLTRHSELELKLAHYQLHGGRARMLTWRNLKLLTRIFEAHFVPVHLPVVTISSTIFANFSPALIQCRYLALVFQITALIRALGFAAMILYYFVFYEAFHQACIDAREVEMRRAGLFEEMEESFARRKKYSPRTWLDYLMFPVAGLIYGSVPLTQAAFSHFWSDRLHYKVSAKPRRLFSGNVSPGTCVAEKV